MRNKNNKHLGIEIEPAFLININITNKIPRFSIEKSDKKNMSNEIVIYVDKQLSIQENINIIIQQYY